MRRAEAVAEAPRAAGVALCAAGATGDGKHRAAAAELIHNIGWPVPPGLFLDQNGSREW